MSWRIISALVALVLAGVGLWWLDGIMARQAWAVWTGKTWGLAAQDWALLRYAWPIALAGSLVGAVCTWWGLQWLASRTAAADYHQRRKQLAQAKQHLDNDHVNLQSKRQELEQVHYSRLADVKHQEQAARAAEQRAADEIEQARAEVARMQKRLHSAERRRQNATAAAGRMRRKAQI